MSEKTLPKLHRPSNPVPEPLSFFRAYPKPVQVPKIEEEVANRKAGALLSRLGPPWSNYRYYANNPLPKFSFLQHRSLCRRYLALQEIHNIPQAGRESVKGEELSLTLKDICFLDTTPKISFKLHFKHEYVFNVLWLYSKEV